MAGGLPIPIPGVGYVRPGTPGYTTITTAGGATVVVPTEQAASYTDERIGQIMGAMEEKQSILEALASNPVTYIALGVGAAAAAAGGAAIGAAGASAGEAVALESGAIASADALVTPELAAATAASEAAALESGAISVGDAVMTGAMPAAIPEAAAPTLLEQAGAWIAKQTATLPQQLAKSVGTQFLMRSLAPKPPARQPIGGRTMDDFSFDLSSFGGGAAANGGYPTMSDWMRLGDTALQIINNRQQASAGQPAPMPVAFPAIGPVVSGAARALGLSGLGAAGAAAVGILRSAGGRILGWVLPSGTKISRAAAVKLAKEMGLSVAAGAIGASAVDLAEAVMQENGRSGKRGRGITSAQLRTTRRTMGKIERMHRLIVKEARKHHAR